MRKLSQLQCHLLTLYKCFKKICDEHNFRYYAVAGTAIGTIRHHGFIPWDDDIDLGMPIEDFEKFKKITKDSLPNNIAFRESYWMGGKIYDTKTTVIDVRFLNNPQNYHGVYIDIFPLIGLPNNKITREKFINDIKSFQTNAELLEFYPEASPFSTQEILNWKNYLQTAYSFNTSNKLAAFCYFMCDGDGIRNPIIKQFEDTEIPISSNYDWDLRNHFGNYMTIPPKEKRKTHDKYHLIDLDTPFSRYAKEYANSQQWLQSIIDQNHFVEGELTQFANSLQYILNQKESIIKDLREKNRTYEKNLNDILNSKTYKISRSLLKPLSIAKRKDKHEK